MVPNCHPMQRDTAAAMKAFAEANQLWDRGDQSTAVAKYRSFLQMDAFNKELGVIYSRIIDFDSEHNNPSSGKALIDKALAAHVDLQLTSMKAKSLLQDQRSVLAEKEKDRKSKDGS